MSDNTNYVKYETVLDMVWRHMKYENAHTYMTGHMRNQT